MIQRIFTYLKRALNLGRRRKQKPAAQPHSFFQLNVDRGENLKQVRTQVQEVAKAFDAPETMRLCAQEAAKTIGKERISLLFYLLQENRMPDTGQPSDNGEIGLLLHHVYENSIFEILYHIGEPSYKLLSNFAFQGDYRMPYKAIEVLCRMAADDIHTDKTVKAIDRSIDYQSNQELLPILHALSLIRTHERVNAIFGRITERYLKNCDQHPKNLRRAVSIIRRWAYSDGQAPRKYLPLLRKLAFGKYKSRRKPACSPEALKFQRIRAALVLDYLEPYDEEVQNLFNKWLVLEENEEIRRYIAEQLEENEVKRAKKKDS